MGTAHSSEGHLLLCPGSLPGPPGPSLGARQAGGPRPAPRRSRELWPYVVVASNPTMCGDKHEGSCVIHPRSSSMRKG